MKKKILLTTLMGVTLGSAVNAGGLEVISPEQINEMRAGAAKNMKRYPKVSQMNIDNDIVASEVKDRIQDYKKEVREKSQEMNEGVKNAKKDFRNDLTEEYNDMAHDLREGDENIADRKADYIEEKAEKRADFREDVAHAKAEYVNDVNEEYRDMLHDVKEITSNPRTVRTELGMDNINISGFNVDDDTLAAEYKEEYLERRKDLREEMVDKKAMLGTDGWNDFKANLDDKIMQKKQALIERKQAFKAEMSELGTDINKLDAEAKKENFIVKGWNNFWIDMKREKLESAREEYVEDVAELNSEIDEYQYQFYK